MSAPELTPEQRSAWKNGATLGEVEAMTAPEVPHADLIARVAAAIYEVRDDKFDVTEWGELDSSERERYECDARAALAALGDTVPREQYDRDVGETARAARADNYHSRMERERDDARAERDALVARETQVRAWRHDWLVPPESPTYPHQTKIYVRRLDGILDTAPAVSLAMHDAEVWDEGFICGVDFENARLVQAANPYRAAAIREEADQ